MSTSLRCANVRRGDRSMIREIREGKLTEHTELYEWCVASLGHIAAEIAELCAGTRVWLYLRADGGIIPPGMYRRITGFIRGDRRTGTRVILIWSGVTMV